MVRGERVLGGLQWLGNARVQEVHESMYELRFSLKKNDRNAMHIMIFPSSNENFNRIYGTLYFIVC